MQYYILYIGGCFWGISRSKVRSRSLCLLLDSVFLRLLVVFSVLLVVLLAFAVRHCDVCIDAFVMYICIRFVSVWSWYEFNVFRLFVLFAIIWRLGLRCLVCRFCGVWLFFFGFRTGGWFFKSCWGIAILICISLWIVWLLPTVFRKKMCILYISVVCICWRSFAMHTSTVQLGGSFQRLYKGFRKRLVALVFASLSGLELYSVLLVLYGYDCAGSGVV